MATNNPDLGRPLDRSCARSREDEMASFCSSNRSRNSNNNIIISNISNINRYGERDIGENKSDIIFNSSNNNSSIITDSSSNSNNNSNSNDSGSDDGNSSTIRHVIGADPWCFAGNNGQVLSGGSNGDAGSLASDSSIAGESIEGGGEEEKHTGEDIGDCASAETSDEEGDTLLGLNERSGGIDMGGNFGMGMGIVIGKKSDNGSDELVATVGSTLALLSTTQAALKEQISIMQGQEPILVEAKAAIRTLAGQLSDSEAEKGRLVLANDELSAKITVVMEEEEQEAASTKRKDDSRQILELTRRAARAEDTTHSFISENADLVADVAEEKRKNRELCAEIALLKATLAKRSDVEASMLEDDLKATPVSLSIAATAQANAAAAETPRSAARRPLAAVDTNSERKCGNGGKSLPSLAYQAPRDCLGKHTPMAMPTPPSSTVYLRRTPTVSPSMVNITHSMVSDNRGCSTTTASRKMDSSPVQNTVSATPPTTGSLRRTAAVSPPSMVGSTQSVVPVNRGCSTTTASRNMDSSPFTTRDYRSNASSAKIESPVQQMAPPLRRSTARLAAKAGRDAAPPPRRSSARIAAQASRDSIATGRGVATRASKRGEDESPLSSLRVTRSTFRAAEKAAMAADGRLTAEPKVVDRKRFMRF